MREILLHLDWGVEVNVHSNSKINFEDQYLLLLLLLLQSLIQGRIHFLVVVVVDSGGGKERVEDRRWESLN